MAKLSSISIALVLLLAMAALVVEVSYGGGEGSLLPGDCEDACEYRCSETSHQKPCLFFCNKCCNTCLCVPPGTYGNNEECPCYNNWHTKEGKPKCP